MATEKTDARELSRSLTPLKALAEVTSLAVRIIFAAVNASLFIFKRKGQPSGVPDLRKGVPVLGVLTCAGAMVAQAAQWAR